MRLSLGVGKLFLGSVVVLSFVNILLWCVVVILRSRLGATRLLVVGWLRVPSRLLVISWLLVVGWLLIAGWCGLVVHRLLSRLLPRSLLGLLRLPTVLLLGWWLLPAVLLLSWRLFPLVLLLSWWLLPAVLLLGLWLLPAVLLLGLWLLPAVLLWCLLSSSVRTVFDAISGSDFSDLLFRLPLLWLDWHIFWDPFRIGWAIAEVLRRNPRRIAWSSIIVVLLKVWLSPGHVVIGLRCCDVERAQKLVGGSACIMGHDAV